MKQVPYLFGEMLVLIVIDMVLYLPFRRNYLPNYLIISNRQVPFRRNAGINSTVKLRATRGNEHKPTKFLTFLRYHFHLVQIFCEKISKNLSKIKHPHCPQPLLRILPHLLRVKWALQTIWGNQVRTTENGNISLFLTTISQ